MSRVWPHAVHAVVLPFAALSLQLWLDAHGRSIPFLLLYPAGLVSACLGGLRWGVAANLLSTGLAWYHLLPRMTTIEPWMIWAIALSTAGGLLSMVRRRSADDEDPQLSVLRTRERIGGEVQSDTALPDGHRV